MRRRDGEIVYRIPRNGRQDVEEEQQQRHEENEELEENTKQEEQKRRHHIRQEYKNTSERNRRRKASKINHTMTSNKRNLNPMSRRLSLYEKNATRPYVSNTYENSDDDDDDDDDGTKPKTVEPECMMW